MLIIKGYLHLHCMSELLVKDRSRAVAIWLLVGVGMIIIQVVLGGVTRLTDSGLSITEWKPLLGTIPPTNETEWNKAFEHYKQIAQYKQLHSYFTLDDFKSIYFWEWIHRVWGRMIGIVFAIPFLIFLIQKRFTSEMVRPMIILFLLGGLQGAIGWIMVQSGLNDENLYVSHIRLAIHFMLALVLLVYVFWFALKLLVKPVHQFHNSSLRNWIRASLLLLFFQLIYGAFMAGLKAAIAAPTWPDINGAIIPNGMMLHSGTSDSLFSAFVNNPITVQFIHRLLAYMLLILIGICSYFSIREKRNSLFNKVKWLPLVFIVIQIGLGIAAVLTSPQKVSQQWGVFEWNAQLHQVVALFLLLALVCILYLLSGKEKLKSSQELDTHPI